MLVQFSVANYRSIQATQTLSMVASKPISEHGNNVVTPQLTSAEKPLDLLSSCLVYGANASGKSNLFDALAKMKTLVMSSAKASQDGDKLDVIPFLFDPKSKQDPTEFEVVFIYDGVRYQYGFVVNTDKVLEEWLFVYQNARGQQWFSRTYSAEVDDYNYKFGSSFSGQKQIWAKSTRSNALFLSTAIQLNSESLKPVFNWFKDKLRIVTPQKLSPSFTLNMMSDSHNKNEIIRLIKSADFNIVDVNVEEVDVDTINDLPSDMLSFFKERKHKIKPMRITTMHQTASSNLEPLDLIDESLGTQRFFSLAGPIIDVLKHGNILVIDELNTHLHPHMVKFLVELFHTPSSNPNQAQLVFTTHETSILNQNIFRRDQVWFCEKNSNQATVVYPLTDFSPRKKYENLEVGYLGGRYGATPILTDFILGE